MKTIYAVVLLALFVLGCQQSTDNAAKAMFDKNCETVKANLSGFAAENLDYSMYAEDAVLFETAVGAEKDSLFLDDIKARDKEIWKYFDFELVTDPVVLLPGVNPETKAMDGSVRYYGDWKVTRPKTDSTEAKSGIVRIYESFDFDEEGKILFQQGYGDFTGLMMHLSD